MTRISIVLGAFWLIALSATVAWAQDDRTADERAIAAVRQSFVGATRANDAQGVVKNVTDDFIFFNPSVKTSPMGKSAYEKLLSTIFTRFKGSVNPWVQYPQKTVVEGDWAFEVGNYGPDNRPPIGFYAWVLQRQPDGSWKISFARFGTPANRGG